MVSINVLEMGPSLRMGILIFVGDGPTPLQGYPLIHMGLSLRMGILIFTSVGTTPFGRVFNNPLAMGPPLCSGIYSGI